MREVRFALDAVQQTGPVTNSWGGWPAGGAVTPYLVLRTTVSGSIDATTGYLCNITFIDSAVRERVIPLLRHRWLASNGSLAYEGLLGEILPALIRALPKEVVVERLELRPTPYLAYGLTAGDPTMVSVTQAFEFSAAHRMYCPELSDEENLAIFGKCTNPSGHGHNYVVEVTVEGKPDPVTGTVMAVSSLEKAVKTHVIDVFDHKHLNKDCDEFAGLNPSIENITRVIWGKLCGHCGRARLACVRVYETPKTYAEYRGEDAPPRV